MYCRQPLTLNKCGELGMNQNCYKALSWVNKTNTSLFPEPFYLETLNNHISFGKCKDKKKMASAMGGVGTVRKGISEKSDI